jgi:hypothetical protein
MLTGRRGHGGRNGMPDMDKATRKSLLSVLCWWLKPNRLPVPTHACPWSVAGCFLAKPRQNGDRVASRSLRIDWNCQREPSPPIGRLDQQQDGKRNVGSRERANQSVSSALRVQNTRSLHGLLSNPRWRMRLLRRREDFINPSFQPGGSVVLAKGFAGLPARSCVRSPT